MEGREGKQVGEGGQEGAQRSVTAGRCLIQGGGRLEEHPGSEARARVRMLAETPRRSGRGQHAGGGGGRGLGGSGVSRALGWEGRGVEGGGRPH